MKKKPIASLLVSVVMLLAVGPSKLLAQTPGQSQIASGERNLSGAQAKPKSELKALFAEELAKGKAGALTEADVKRMEKENLDPRSSMHQSSGVSKKKVVLMVVILVVIVGLAIVLAHNGVNPSSTCDEDPFAPDCIP